MAKQKKWLSVDGNTAAALGSYNFTEVAGIFPITPSSPMAELVDLYSSQGKLNFFNSQVKVCELQSEGGASGSVHGALQAGTYATTYTASQGLLLMIPNIYKWVGELLPAVIHVSARSLATRSLSIFGDHQDIYACRQTGAIMLCSHSVQEVADLSNVAHLIAIDAQMPVIHYFDGFRTSHEIQNAEFVDDESWKKLIPQEKVELFRNRALNPHTHPVTRGGAENDDIYFQGREAQNTHYNAAVDCAVKFLNHASKLTGRKYAPFTYHGDKNATDVVVAMGSVTETTLEVLDELEGKGFGLVKVHLYRPFSISHLLKVLPKTVKRIAVLDRTKEHGATGEPLFLDVVAALAGKKIKVYGGRYGLSSKDTQPKHIKSVYDFLRSDKVHHNFTVGIHDDVTFLSIPVDEDFHVNSKYTSCLFYGLGSDGTVSANKSSIKIIGDGTKQFTQAYFAYDSRKAGGVTRSHLRFGREPIRSTYYVKNADFVSCSLDGYAYKFDMVRNLKKGGTFLLNTDLSDDQIESMLPNKMKKQLADKGAKFYVIDANKIAKEIGMGRRTNTILQASFFYLNQQIMAYETAVNMMKEAAKKAYGRKGDDIVKMNYKAIDAGHEGLRQITIKPEWSNLVIHKEKHIDESDYFTSYVSVIGTLGGDDLPVSKFTEFELLDGTMQPNITFREKRNIADRVPVWHKDACIQCNQCAFVCPHATLRPFLLTEDEVKNSPDVVRNDVANAIGGPNVKDYKYRLQVSSKNCVGCGLCVVECMANKTGKNAIEMVDARDQAHQEEGADYLYNNICNPQVFPNNTVKGISFMKPYMEVSGACAGCGETPYYKLVSQLFGNDMLVANATGCSSIYSGSTPLTPFNTDCKGEGIAWANSLFEDNAEFGFGMRLATDYKLDYIGKIVEAAILSRTTESELRDLLRQYSSNVKNRAYIRNILPRMITLIEESKNKKVKELLNHKRDLLDKSVWIIGGDGWAYDIGYGGLDHVIANNEDVNILVLDTEVYSNTGGQSSKSSQAGSIAKFTASGKKTAKKNLALMAMAYGHVYVAQIAIGANPMKAIQAIKEAESYNGPSLIICYAPCVNHGIKGGLSNSILTEKRAVESGYFNIFRYDPRKEKQLEIDFLNPDYSKFRDFIMAEVRYNQLPIINPKEAEVLLTKTRTDAEKRFVAIKRFGGIE